MGKGLGSRHETFATLVITARNFRDPNNPNRTGLTLEIPDIAQIRALLESEVGHYAMREDRPEVSTFRMLTEFTR